MENQEKTVLLTGATSGIGLELAKIFAKDGYRLIIVARKENELADTVATLAAEGATTVVPIAIDLFEASAAEELYQQVTQTGWQIDVLVNDAGQGVYGLFVENELADELQIIQLNISSVVALTKIFLKDMVARGNGKILNVASIASKSPGPWQAVYHGTKAFVHSFTEAVRYEVKESGVSLTSLLPGATDTDFFRKAGMETSKIVAEGELANAADVAKDGYEALMAGKDMVVSGFKNKLNVAMGNVLPDSTNAAMMAKLQEPVDKC